MARVGLSLRPLMKLGLSIDEAAETMSAAFRSGTLPLWCDGHRVRPEYIRHSLAFRIDHAKSRLTVAPSHIGWNRPTYVWQTDGAVLDRLITRQQHSAHEIAAVLCKLYPPHGIPSEPWKIIDAKLRHKEVVTSRSTYQKALKFNRANLER
jgi:hypothetical protein